MLEYNRKDDLSIHLTDLLMYSETQVFHCCYLFGYGPSQKKNKKTKGIYRNIRR